MQDSIGERTDRARLLAAIKKRDVHWLLHLLKELDIDQSDLDVALHAACWSGQSDCIAILIAAGADMYSLNQHKEHILLEVVHSANINALRAILEAGYDVNFMSGKTEFPAPLHVAISGRDRPNYDTVDLLIDSGFDPECRDVDGDTALISASNMADLRVARKLLSANCKVDAIGYEGNTALHRAVEGGSMDLVLLLLEHGASMEVENTDGNTPLLIACENGHEMLVKLLLSKDTAHTAAHQVNKYGKGCIHLAAFSGKVELIPDLLAANLPTASLDMYGNTALISAVMMKNSKFALHLLNLHGKEMSHESYAAHINHTGGMARNALHWAAWHGLTDVLEFLVTGNPASIKFNVQDKNGDTAVILAAKTNRNSVLKLLVKNGSDVNVCGDLGRTALHWAVLTANKTGVETLLSVEGIKVNLVDKSGNSPLILAACNRKYEEMTILLKSPFVDVNVKDDQDRTALHWVSLDACTEMIEQLVASPTSADVNVQDKHGEYPLLLTLKQKHLPSINVLLGVPNIDIHCTGSDGCQPLHYACMYGFIDVVKQLLEKGSEAHCTERVTGCTPLILAAKNGHGSLVSFLVDSVASIDVNAVDKDLKTALFYVAQSSLEDAAKRLMDAGADPNAEKCEPSALIQSAKAGNKTIVDLLISHNAKINIRDSQKKTALMWASQGGHTQIVECLLQAGAKAKLQDASGDTALTIAIWHGHLETVKILIPVSDIEHRELDEGMPALHLAIAKDQKDIVHELLSAGACVNTPDVKGNNALLTAMIHTTGSEIVSMLLEHSGLQIDINYKGDQGRSALHWAVGDSDCLKIVLKKQPDVNMLDSNGASPLLLAIAHAKPESAQLLIENGSDYNLVHKDGRVALHHASIYGVSETVKLLLSLGVDPDTPTTDGKMPLLLASIEGHIEIVRLLIARGSDVNRTYFDAMTALSAAAGGKHHEVMESLLEAGADPDRFGSRKCSPLMTCILNNDLRGTLLLIQHGANLDQKIDKDKHPIHGAVVNSYMDILHLLISIECNVNFLQGLLKEGLVYYFVDDIPFLALLADLSKSPKSLKMLCRNNIRHHLTIPVMLKINNLPVPNIIKDYLAMKDLKSQPCLV